jgi:hypothetical protein
MSREDRDHLGVIRTYVTVPAAVTEAVDERVGEIMIANNCLAVEDSLE